MIRKPGVSPGPAALHRTYKVTLMRSFSARSFRLAVLAVSTAVALALQPQPAMAQSEEGFDKAPEDTVETKKHLAQEQGDLMPGEKVAEAPVTDPAEYDPKEEPGKAYRFVGLRMRNVILPKFMMGLFAEGGSTLNVFMFGPEFTSRRDNTEFDFALQFADYSMDPFLFKGHGENEFSYEEVSSDMKALYLTLDMLYDIPVDKTGKLSMLVGGGVGLGFFTGNLYRAQVEPTAAGNGKLNPDEFNSWQKCRPVPPSPPSSYCDAKNDHYGNYDEPSWANGGSRPFVFPWISLPQVSVRYKPIKQLQTRFDAGFSLSGFFLGLSAGYGL